MRCEPSGVLPMDRVARRTGGDRVGAAGSPHRPGHMGSAVCGGKRSLDPNLWQHGGRRLHGTHHLQKTRALHMARRRRSAPSPPSNSALMMPRVLLSWWCLHSGWRFRGSVRPPASGSEWSKGIRWSISQCCAGTSQPGAAQVCHCDSAVRRRASGIRYFCAAIGRTVPSTGSVRTRSRCGASATMLRAVSAGTGLVPWSSPGRPAPPWRAPSRDITGTVTVTAAWRRSQSSWVGQVSVTVWM